MDWWVYGLGGALVAGFRRLVAAMKVWYEMLQARRRYLDMKRESKRAQEKDDVRRVAKKIETIIGPKVGSEYGNVFRLDFIAREINQGTKITGKALLYLEHRNRAHRQDGNWWKLEPREKSNPWGNPF